MSTAGLLVGCGRQVSESNLGLVEGVRLGMSPRDVRERWVNSATSSGSWRVSVGPDGDTVLDWSENASAASNPERSPGAGSGPVKSARFDFHLGMLVAIHAQLREKTTRPIVEITSAAASVREPASEGSSLVIVARDCPTHRGEASAIEARAAR